MIQSKRFFRPTLHLIVLFLLIFSVNASASHSEEGATEKPYDPKETTFHHLMDNYDWEFESLGKIRLPRILYHTTTGLQFFANTDAAMEKGWIEEHEFNHEAGHGDLLPPQAIELKTLQAQLINQEEPVLKHPQVVSELNENLKIGLDKYRPLDFSITKNVVFIFITAILMLVIFINVASAYKKNAGKAPKGMQNFFETIIVYIRDDVAKFNIGHHYEPFMPLLLTTFFFIWFLNLLGMMPFSANVTGNISVTFSLAFVTLIVMLVKANKHFWSHTLNPDVPHWVKPILVPVEILGIFTKPFALMMRLFANITAGHVMMISLLGLIFIFGKNGQNAGAGFGVGFGATLFVVAISLLELFVALLQAYVFTMLTAVFIGQVTAEGEHH